jgi:hypothetical protein
MSLLDCAAAGCSLLALAPAFLIWRNLGRYLTPPPLDRASRPGCSVLIPARNEEANIEAAVRSILNNVEVDLEVLVADDHSTDATAAIVRQLATADPRVRLVRVPALPPGWCGKQHACQVLAGHASRPIALFMDADVRLSPDAINRMAAFMAEARVDLISGVPRQETRSFSEKLLVPLIHFVLLGFLPIKRMRSSRSVSFAAGCGQLFMARLTAYRTSGGHGALLASLHDGLRLPRAFRAAGFRTDLFDASEVAACRMYSSQAQVWRGLARNAHEGLGSPGLIGPATVLFAGGQILPWLFLALAPSKFAFEVALPATVAILLIRFALAFRFNQSFLGALLHPIGIGALLGIQWFAFFRSTLNRPSRWRDRSYLPAPAL